MRNMVFAVTLGLTFATTLAACGGADTPPEKEKAEIPDIVKRAASGDEDAMRILERKLAEKTEAEKKKLATTSKDGNPLAAFQKALTSGQGNQGRINALAKAGNANAQLWNAVSNRSRSDLSAADKQLYRTHLQTIARNGQNDRYAGLTNANWSLSAEAAFQIAEDKLTSKWLFGLDTDGAVTYLKQAAESGQPEAMFKLSARYQYALDMDKDMTKAKYWLEKSANAGNHDAKAALKSLEE